MPMQQTAQKQDNTMSAYTVYKIQKKSERINNVIIEKYKKRTAQHKILQYELLAKEEYCCAIATD